MISRVSTPLGAEPTPRAGLRTIPDGPEPEEYTAPFMMADTGDAGGTSLLDAQRGDVADQPIPLPQGVPMPATGAVATQVDDMMKALDPEAHDRKPLGKPAEGAREIPASTPIAPVAPTDVRTPAERLAALSPDAQAAVASLQARGVWDASLNNQPPLSAEVDRFLAKGGPLDVAEEVLFQVAYPENISQIDGKDTCAATATQLVLAQQAPGIYFKLATDLMTPPGKAVLPHGDTAAPPFGDTATVSRQSAEWIADPARNFSLCQTINATVQAGLMDYANGNKIYNMATDVSKTEDANDDKHGLDMTQFNVLNSATLGVYVLAKQFTPAMKPIMRNGEPEDEDIQMMRFTTQLKSQLNSAQKDHDKGFLVPIKEGNLTHMIMVTGVDAGKGIVTYTDPKGGTQTMDVGDLAYVIANPWKGGQVGTGTTTSGTTTYSGTRRTP